MNADNNEEGVRGESNQQAIEFTAGSCLELFQVVGLCSTLMTEPLGPYVRTVPSQAPKFVPLGS